MNKQNLIRTAEAIAKGTVAVEHGVGFNMGSFAPDGGLEDMSGYECSAAMCGAGWAVYALGRPSNSHDEIENDARELLGLNYHEMCALFYPGWVDGVTMSMITPDMAVNTYLYAAEHDVVDWNGAQRRPPARPWETPR